MANQRHFLSCKDYLVSGEEFDLFWHKEHEILETKPVPVNLPFYYSSDRYISHTDSKENFTEKLYQQVKNYMMGKKISWIKNYKTSGKILDVGAGTGDFLITARKHHFEIFGTEPNETARGMAIRKDVSLVKDYQELKIKNYDVITLWHVLEHIKEPEEGIAKLSELLDDDGVLVIAVPNFKSFDAQHYKECWAAYDVPRHLFHFSQKGIESLFTAGGFELLSKKPLIFDSFYVSLLSEKNKTGSSNYIKAFYNGLKSNIKAKTSTEYSSLVYFFRKSKNGL
ncbi:class I SAM-dependent methyltransferase [Autumnicola musiva]|uniref:Class I SAM-dependent methyltransferase n=1 Tax=Autumnicola musiva TaxID=3075589 RepID=A0ABU3D1L5_9FLAO|nr:class I SAM-dependent methyltransferase [Zunongwangia sp. F117]MDT0675369.1 class I SAM-dependent methyltransferase [Zunongwangia sp. F117]